MFFLGFLFNVFAMIALLIKNARDPTESKMSSRLDRSLAALMLVSAACLGCGSDVASPDTGSVRPSPQAQAYLDEVVGIMKANSINRLVIDWNSFTADVQSAAANAQTIAETYPAIRVALGLLGDGHSSFRTAQGTWLSESNRTCTAPPIGDITTRPTDIGYVRVRSFGGSAAQATRFAESLQDSIEANDHEGIGGWIVDLRGNSGGNMWPMIAGIGPLLGNDTTGFFITPTGVESAWGYRDGDAWLTNSVVQSVSPAYSPIHESPYVAVLTDNRVASSGEAVVIAFRERAGTRFFGTQTCGLSTANRGFVISDGALLNLTVAVMADRTKSTYGDVVEPDESISDPEQVVLRAIEWLRQR